MYDDLAKLLSDFISKSGSSIDDVAKNFDNYLDDAIKNGFDYSTINSQEKLNQFYDARTQLKSYYENQHGDILRQQRQMEIEAKKKASKASDPEYWNGQKKFDKWDQADGSTIYKYYNEKGEAVVQKIIGPDGKRDVGVIRPQAEMDELVELHGESSLKKPLKKRLIREGDTISYSETPNAMDWTSTDIDLKTGERIDKVGRRDRPWGGGRSVEPRTNTRNLYDDLAARQSKNLKPRRLGMGSIRESAGIAGTTAEFKHFFQKDPNTGKPFAAPWSESGKANSQVNRTVKKARQQQEARRARQNSNNRKRMTVEEARQARQERRSQKNREIEQPKINADTVEESISQQSETVVNKTEETIKPNQSAVDDNINDAINKARENSTNINKKYETPETFEDFYNNMQQNRNSRVDNTPIDNTAPEVPETPEVPKTPETPEINYNRPDDFSNVLNPDAANEALDEALNNALNNMNNKATGYTSTLGNTINLNRSNNINAPKNTSINLNQTTGQTVNQTVNQTANQAVNQTVNQAVNQTANQTVNQAVNQQAQNANNILNNAINQQNANLNANLGNSSANILNNQRNLAANGYTTKPITGVGPNGQLIKGNQTVVKNVNNGSGVKTATQAANNANPLKTFKDMSGLEKVMTGVNVLGMVGDYKQARREGHGVVSSAVRAGAQFAFAEAMGWWYIPYSLVKEAPGAIIKGADALYKENRRMNSAANNQIFGGAQFQDTQQLATMRQSGMEMAKMAQYNLQQTLMGQEATYLHR